MKRDDAVVLMDHFASEVKHAGTTTAPYHGFNGWTAYLVKDTKSPLANAKDWEVPGLFISYNELKAIRKPYLTIFYKMGCGAILVLVLPVVKKGNEFKVPNNFMVLRRNGVFNGEEGLWIALEHWHNIGNTNDYVNKKGSQKRQHLAKKPDKV